MRFTSTRWREAFVLDEAQVNHDEKNVIQRLEPRRSIWSLSSWTIPLETTRS